MELVFGGSTPGERPEPSRLYDLIIVGGGPAGLTAALYASRASLSTAILERGTVGGLMVTTERVENCPGCFEGSGADIAQYLLRQATKFGAQYGTAEVSELDVRASPKKSVASAGIYLARTLIIATGSQPRRLDVPGERKYWGRGVSFCSTCDAPFFTGKRIAVVGGGESALQESEFLLRYASHLTILQDLDHLTATPVLRDRVLSRPNVRVIFNILVREIQGDDRVIGVEIEDRRSGARETIAVEGVFIFIGLVPSTKLVEGQLDLGVKGDAVTTSRRRPAFRVSTPRATSGEAHRGRLSLQPRTAR